MRGIMFIELLYNRTVQGFKTMTRRTGGLDAVNQAPAEWDHAGWQLDTKSGKHQAIFINIITKQEITCRPLYGADNVVYLKEPVFIQKAHEYNFHTYKYNGAPLGFEVPKYINKMFMPASAARAFIDITGIKVERLHDISDQDCIAEGIEEFKAQIETFNIDEIIEQKPLEYYDPLSRVIGNKVSKEYPEYIYKNYFNKHIPASAKQAFFSLFKFANKLKATADIPNPWVFCYSYKYLPIDKLTGHV